MPYKILLSLFIISVLLGFSILGVFVVGVITFGLFTTDNDIPLMVFMLIYGIPILGSVGAFGVLLVTLQKVIADELTWKHRR